MVTTAIVQEGNATIVDEKTSAFEWGAVAAGAIVAAATTFFLIVVGAAVGLSLAGTRSLSGAHTFLTLGAIYFFAAQAFGFALGGYITGRMMRTALESEDEHFRADAHGLAVWSLAAVIGLGFVALGTAAGLNQAAPSATQPIAYWSDKLVAEAPIANYDTRNAIVSRLLVVDAARPADQANEDHNHLVALVAAQNGISAEAAAERVQNVENGIRAEAKAARQALLYLTMWTAFALLFGAFVTVASTVMAHFQQEDFHFRFRSKWYGPR